MGLGFGIYEVEDKEDGVWGLGFGVSDFMDLNIILVVSL